MMKKVIFLIAGIALFIGIANMPYGYYQLLRWFTFAVGTYGAYLNYKNEKIGWAWTLGIIALIVNPFVKFYFSKGAWKVVDFIGGMLFCIYFNKSKKE